MRHALFNRSALKIRVLLGVARQPCIKMIILHHFESFVPPPRCNAFSPLISRSRQRAEHHRLWDAGNRCTSDAPKCTIMHHFFNYSRCTDGIASARIRSSHFASSWLARGSSIAIKAACLICHKRLHCQALSLHAEYRAPDNIQTHMLGKYSEKFKMIFRCRRLCGSVLLQLRAAARDE